MPTKPLKPMSPYAARKLADICCLQRDNLQCPTGEAILIDEGTVTLWDAKGDRITLVRRDFERLAKWYFRPQNRVRR